VHWGFHSACRAAKASESQIADAERAKCGDVRLGRIVSVSSVVVPASVEGADHGENWCRAESLGNQSIGRSMLTTVPPWFVLHLKHFGPCPVEVIEHAIRSVTKNGRIPWPSLFVSSHAMEKERRDGDHQSKLSHRAEEQLTFCIEYDRGYW
jgi:hypothetical protein